MSDQPETGQPAGSFGYCAVCYHPLDQCSHCDAKPAPQTPDADLAALVRVVTAMQDGMTRHAAHIEHAKRSRQRRQARRLREHAGVIGQLLAALTAAHAAKGQAEQGWARWLGPSETPLERMEREWRDCQAVTGLLAEERRKAEDLAAKLAAAEQRADQLRSALADLPEWTREGWCVYGCGAHRVGATSNGNEIMAHIVYDREARETRTHGCESCHEHKTGCQRAAIDAALRATEPRP